MVSVKLINTTAHLQTLLLSGGQPIPLPPEDKGVTVSFDEAREDDRKQMARLKQALEQRSVKRQRERGDLKVEGLEQLSAVLEGKKSPAPTPAPAHDDGKGKSAKAEGEGKKSPAPTPAPAHDDGKGK